VVLGLIWPFSLVAEADRRELLTKRDANDPGCVKTPQAENDENGLSQIDQKSTALINSNDPNCVSKSFERYRVFTQPRPTSALDGPAIGNFCCGALAYKVQHGLR
jgi:hypothetical protein